jgi:cobalt-zinc-cadmium efflux system membrane fusion protein
VKITKTTAWACVAACCLLSGCHKQQGDTKNEASTKAEGKGPADEVTLSPQAQAEQKIEVAPVELGTAAATQRAKGRIALSDNATWRVGVLAEGRVEKVYFNLGDYVKKARYLPVCTATSCMRREPLMPMQPRNALGSKPLKRSLRRILSVAKGSMP